MGEHCIFGERDKIQVLLTEYTSLRTEIIHRVNNMYQLLAVVGALCGWAVTREKFDVRWWAAVVPVAIALIACWLMLNSNIRRVAAHLREIECSVNARAGENLLVWESTWGGFIATVIGRRRRPGLSMAKDSPSPSSLKR